MDRKIKDISLNWKTVPGFKYYEVSDTGEVWSSKQNKLLADNRNVVLSRRNREGQIEKKTFTKARLVATLFLSNPKKFRCLNFKDEDVKNAAVSNLEWTKGRYNKLSIKTLDKKLLKQHYKKYKGTLVQFWRENYKSQISITTLRKLLGITKDSFKLPQDTQNEKWKRLKGDYQNLSISNKGRVWNNSRGRLLKRNFNGRNLVITNPNPKKTLLVHMLVAQNFLKGYNKKKHDVVFRDGRHRNTQLSNLDFQSKSLRGFNFRPER